MNQTLSPCRYCGGPVTSQQIYCCRACQHLDQIQELRFIKQNFQLKSEDNALAYLDDPANLSDWAQNESKTEFILKVSGLECASCVHLIEKIPDYFDEIKSLTVDYGKAQIKLELFKPEGLSKYAKILKEWGYDCFPLTPLQLISPRKAEGSKSLLKRLAVAGAITGNVMLFAIPVYSGVTGPIKTAFMWLQFLLFLPLYFYSALPFFKGAWNSLMIRTLSIDLPMTLALTVGFVFSTINLIHGSDEIYFDSMASFIFLILVTRYFVQIIQQKTEFHFTLDSFVPPQKYEVLRLGTIMHLHQNELCVGDKVQVLRGQILPADGSLISDKAEIDSSLFSGESFPQHYSCGMKLSAGTKLLSEKVEIQVTQAIENSALSHLLKELEKGSLNRNSFTRLTDVVSQYLIVIVFAVATGYFLLNFQADFKNAFHRSLALLIIACPCALAFGSPLAFALGLRRAKEKGILIKNPDVFEKIRHVENIFMDKTGTLTNGQLRLGRSMPQEIPDHIKALILNIEKDSHHPVAFAFRRAWSHVSPSKVEKIQIKEILGQGIQAVIDGVDYCLEKSDAKDSAGMICVSLKKQNEAMAYFYFVDEPLPATKEVVEKIKKRFHVFLISGDRSVNVKAMADFCGVRQQNYFSECTPDMKKKILEKHTGSLMIGDGLNDLLAFQKADVSVSVQGSHLKNQNVADVLLLKTGLNPLIDLIQISDKTYRSLTTNLTFALLYNFIAGFCALSGFVNPLVAALLMPASSLMILGMTFWGMK